MRSLIFLGTALLIAVVFAEETARPSGGYSGRSGRGGYPDEYPPTNGYPSHDAYDTHGRGGPYYGGRSYGSDRTYGARRSYRPTYYPPPPPPPPRDEPLNELDKLYERVTDVLKQVKFLSEMADSLSARLSIQEKQVNELVTVVFVALREIDERQNASIAKLLADYEEVDDDCDELTGQLMSLVSANNGNLDQWTNNAVAIAERVRQDIGQDGEIAGLHAVVNDLKPKLFQVMGNRFTCFRRQVERDDTSLQSIKKRETARMCEVGQVTLRAREIRVEYPYQNWFDNVPQVIFGLSGFQYNLDAKPDATGYGHGSYYPPREPEASGVAIHAYSTKSALVIQATDLSFGDTQAESADISFQVCTIGAGVKKPITPAPQ